MKIKVEATVDIWETREADLEDSWDRGDTAGRVTGVYVADEKMTSGYEFEVDANPGDLVYVVVADYESGDTFGRIGGGYQIIDVFADEVEADNLCAAALDFTNNRNGMSFSFVHKNKNYYASWVGYFEYLNDIVVWPVHIRTSYQYNRQN
jgi:hypothetical protein